MKKQPREWKKLFANDETEKELISKLYEIKISINKVFWEHSYIHSFFKISG